MSKYVIIGACAAGVGAIEAIREVDPSGSIAVISEEVCPHYSRPMISDFVSGKADFEKMKTRSDEFWQENKVEALAGKKAASLNTAEHAVVLDDGEKVPYEKLFIATGGKPFVPKMEGSDKKGVYTFTTVNDAQSISKKIDEINAKNVVVIGAGLIGISVTDALVKRGLKVTLVELQDKILSLILDPQASTIVEEVIKKAGVNILTGKSVTKILGKPQDESSVGGVTLTTGEQLPCDLVIVAIGVIPRTEVVAGTDVKTNRGILVDSRMQTSIPDIYAGGDVAEAYDFLLDQNRLLPLWPLAVLEGKIAGYNMAGKPADYAGGTNMSSLKYFGVPIVSVGLANPKDPAGLEILTHTDENKRVYKKLVLKDGVIVGMTFLGDIERAGIIFYLIKNKVNVDDFKQSLLSEDFGLAILPAPLREKLGFGGKNDE
ncbi:MAG: FAD-dependent oxidoreductase [Candidatus Bathyarchaeota archaeon]|nr:FAD-dependent oxidoreductase [Candidatus Bathyarchaeota archaeon]